MINRIAEVEIPKNTGDFRLMSRRAVDEINQLKECHGFLRGMVASVGFPQTSVLFDRPPRFSGRANYNRFLGSLRIGFNGIFCFSNYGLTLSTLAGFAVAALSFLIGAVYALLKLFGAPFPLGNPTIVILVLFFGRRANDRYRYSWRVNRENLRRGTATAQVYCGRCARFRTCARWSPITRATKRSNDYPAEIIAMADKTTFCRSPL